LGAVIIGIVGGCLGALFISVNFKMNVIRKRLLKTKWIKVIETGFWCALTASAFVLISYFSWKTQDNVCEPLTNLKTADAKSIVHQGWCPEGQFDPNISLYFATEGGIIRNIMNKEVTVQYGNLCVFLLMWYLFTITTYGTNVPAGLFLPGMIIGCALGAFIFRTMDYGHLIIGD
jgi:H+/Cl- antiporter ClcA